MIENDEEIHGEKESTEELIIEIVRRAGRVRNASSGAVASDFENLQSFLKAGKKRLSNIKNSAGKAILNEDQISSIIAENKAIPIGLSLQEVWVFFLGRLFLQSQVEMVKNLSFSSFDINPLLAKALSLDTARKVIAFNVYQTVTRSVVTSWGNTVERIAKFVGCKDNDYILPGGAGTNFDLMKTVEGVDYYIQVKSGPNTMNVGMVTSLNRAIAHLEKGRTKTKGILGMTYGTRPRISNQIISNLNDANTRMKVGREFWDFVSEKKDFHNDLFRLLDASSTNILDGSFIETIEAKINQLEKEWLRSNPKNDLDEMLAKFI